MIDLGLGDIISYCNNKGYRCSKDYMVYQNRDKTYGFINLSNGEASEPHFNTLDEMRKYLKASEDVNKKIAITKRFDWIVYCP